MQVRRSSLANETRGTIWWSAEVITARVEQAALQLPPQVGAATDSWQVATGPNSLRLLKPSERNAEIHHTGRIRLMAERAKRAKRRSSLGDANKSLPPMTKRDTSLELQIFMARRCPALAIKDRLAKAVEGHAYASTLIPMMTLAKCTHAPQSSSDTTRKVRRKRCCAPVYGN